MSSRSSSPGSGAATQPRGRPPAGPKSSAPSRAPRPAVSRRRFMALLASASAATLVAPARPLIGAARGVAAPKKPALSPRMLAEIEKQKKYVADTLKVIRGFSLPPGSDMAFEFRPLRPTRRK